MMQIDQKSFYLVPQRKFGGIFFRIDKHGREKLGITDQQLLILQSFIPKKAFLTPSFSTNGYEVK